MKRRGGLLLLIRGFPGCGKSTLARNLVNMSSDRDFIRLDPDSVITSQLDRDSLLNFEGESVEVPTLVYRFLLMKAREALIQGNIVLWDQPWRSLWGIDVTIEKLEESAGYFKLIILELLLPAPVVKQRMKQRMDSGGHGPAEELFDRMVQEFEYAPQDRFRVVQLDASGCPIALANQVMRLLEKEL
ncbi:MAG: ATP-binding protein [Patescibacteria group bacterium]